MSKGNATASITKDQLIQALKPFSEKSSVPRRTGSLKRREVEFLRLACSEMTYKEIAGKMFLSVRTIDGYRDSLFEKLACKSRVGLVLYAIKTGIVPVDQLKN